MNNSNQVSSTMPRFEIDKAEVSSIRTERDVFFERKRDELATHRGRTRRWHLVFIRANKETLSCRDMHVDMVLHHIIEIENHFNDNTLASYMMMCSGLRTVVTFPDDPCQETPVRRVYRAPRATCTICGRPGEPYTVCGEESGGLHVPNVGC